MRLKKQYTKMFNNTGRRLSGIFDRKRVSKKLSSRRGESLIETLFSMLISVLGILMFAGATAAAGRMVTSGKSTMDAYYEQNNNLTQEKTGTADGSAVKVQFTQIPGEASGLAGSADLAKKQSDLLGHMVVYTNSKRTVSAYRTSESKENDPAAISGESETP